jgi:hypothetical protein
VNAIPAGAAIAPYGGVMLYDGHSLSRRPGYQFTCWKWLVDAMEIANVSTHVIWLEIRILTRC